MKKRKKKEKMRRNASEEWQKIRQMDLKSAVIYLWDYYKLWIIGISVFIFLVFYFISVFLNRPKDTLLHVTMVNFYDNVSEDSDFYKDFIAYSGFNEEEGEVIFDANVFFNLKRPADGKSSYFQKTVAFLEAKTTDAVICEYDNLMGIGSGGRFLDLSDEKAASIYEKYQDRIVYLEPEEGMVKEGEEKERVPIGIDISDSPVLARMNGYADKCYLAVSAYTERLDAAEIFIDYLLQDVL